MAFKVYRYSAYNLKYRLVLITNSYQPLIFGDFKQEMINKLHEFGERNDMEILSVEIIDNAVMDILFSASVTTDISRFLNAYRTTITKSSDVEHVDLNGYSFWSKQTLLMTVGQENTPKDDEVVIEFIKAYGNTV